MIDVDLADLLIEARPRVVAEFDTEHFGVWSTTEGQLLVWPLTDKPADFIALLAVPEMLCGHC